ncbi:MAG: DUF4224 domain-containing protein [Rhodocyclales bacterium]|nr:DUF4224 domain-containing protein [Rhodocyclales bacterium]
MTKPTFLNADEIRTLTGRVQKARQIESLRKMGILFFVNALGNPVVPRASIEGNHGVTTGGEKPNPAWEPNVACIQKRPPRGRYEE